MTTAVTQVGARTIPWRTLSELLRDKACRFGNRQFAEIDGSAISYSALEQQAARLAGGLASAGLGKGDRVATFMFNGPEQLISLFAAARIGAIWTPINGGLVGRDLAYTLEDSGAKLLIVDRENYGKLNAVSPEILKQVHVHVTGTGPLQPGHQSYEALARSSDLGTEPGVEAEDAAIILYTGGTTGLPKGVVLSHMSFILAGLRYGETFGVRAGERHYTTLPLFHAAALQFAVMGPLVNDMTTVLDRRFSVSSYWARVRETGANVIDPIGSMLTLLCQQPKSDRDRDHGVRISIGIFAQIPPEVPQRFTKRFGVPLVSIYGLTEAGGAMITSNRLDDPMEGSTGKTHGWAELRIGDQDDLPVQSGETGQILLRPTHPHMFMLRYHNSPDKTLESFRNLWLQTGDLGRVDEDGNLFYIGRKAHWIRRRGENISAFEIEAILAEMPGIQEAVVIGVPSELGEDDIKAFIIGTAEARAPEAIIAWCQTRMAGFKVPRFIEFVEDFPRSVTKREVERAVLKTRPNDQAWDRERVMGRLSGQARC
ncbi:crotonobetaine/carnitine-CoA ligase [Rhodoligotrophos appendicifer]|uniref:AMP-binding protein n=1 Tax=Rhodoligotrophos appendicifer TaxID=987056 RepID=UPI001184A848|nr:AMP-binding protein [Rhodoligotrophos appendicifer]